jgi:glucose/arabinose dehydrogenase
MRWSSQIPTAVIAAIALVSASACDDNSTNSITAPSPTIVCDADNAGITLPSGFCAVAVADLTSSGQPAAARHMAITPNGDLFVAINSPGNQNPEFGVIGLRDTNGDGKADVQSPFSANLGGSGIAWMDGHLFFGANDRVLRFNLPSGQMAPTGNADVVVSGLPNTGDHISKTIVLANATTMYVNIGSMTNSCQVANRQLHSPGQSPCPELATRAGVWSFDPNGTNQTEANGHHYAMGYRNLVAMAMNPANQTLYAIQQGRDMLNDNWPEHFTVDQGAVLPAEELVRVSDGSNNGWPYCFFDGVTQHKKLLAPEYGGDGTMTSGGTSPVDCGAVNQPLATFGAHWSPDGATFYTGSQFPAHYRGGAFIAFHGGFDRAPLPNEGFKVMFQPMNSDGNPSGDAEVFADGFAGSTGALPQTALHRPVGVMQGPDGSLYVSDDQGGRIYRIIYRP